MSDQPNCRHCGAGKYEESDSECMEYHCGLIKTTVYGLPYEARASNCYEREIANLKAELATAKGEIENLKKQREEWEKYRAQIMSDMEKFMIRSGVI